MEGRADFRTHIIKNYKLKHQFLIIKINKYKNITQIQLINL